MISGILAGGIPGFRMALLLPAPFEMAHGDFVVFSVAFVYGPASV